jgi:hypothetical protein
MKSCCGDCNFIDARRITGFTRTVHYPIVTVTSLRWRMETYSGLKMDKIGFVEISTKQEAASTLCGHGQKLVWNGKRI